MVERIGDMMKAAGLRNIAADVYRIPMGSWGGRIGEMVWDDLKGVFTAGSPMLAAAGGVTQEEMLAAIAQIGQETNEYQGYWEYFKFCGQKPE